MASNYTVDTGNALEKQPIANETANREADDYRELQVAALEKLEPDVRSKHALLQGKGTLYIALHAFHALLKSIEEGNVVSKT